MKYFSIETIKAAIEGLQSISANWLLPAFVFAANDVGTSALVDMSQRQGTDQFLDKYFNGSRLSIPPFSTGNNLLRPRLKGISWNRGEFADDYIIRQNTKMWGNLFSSRGYREMRLSGLIEGEKTINKLTDAFQARFEAEVPDTFQFEDFLVWLFAFEGFPNEIGSWQALFDHLLGELHLDQFDLAYRGRFKLSEPAKAWPETLDERPTNEAILAELAPKLVAYLAKGGETLEVVEDQLNADDPVLAMLMGAIASKESLSFLLAGPPGTGKTRQARQIANHITQGKPEQVLFLQFHPAIGYDDFVEGFRPTVSDGGNGVRYELAPRIFLEFARKAAQNPKENYVAVIDELNRGDVARVFGELLTYMEVDYRGQEFSLSYSGEKASIPQNLILIATANPFDRSVTDLDEALLRRFWVIELEPDGPFLRSFLETKNVDADVVNRTLRMFEILNNIFPSGFGHTNFLKVGSVEDLGAIWSGRIRLALKRAFVHDKATYDATASEIEQLLSLKDGENIDGQDE